MTVACSVGCIFVRRKAPTIKGFGAVGTGIFLTNRCIACYRCIFITTKITLTVQDLSDTVRTIQS